MKTIYCDLIYISEWYIIDKQNSKRESDNSLGLFQVYYLNVGFDKMLLTTDLGDYLTQ